MPSNRFPRRALVMTVVSLTAVSCSGDDGSPQTTTRASGDVFDTTRHVVIDGIEHDGFETITVLAHLCSADDSDCPSGDEELVVLASKHLTPGEIYLSAPEVYLEPPERCLADDMACRLSMVHCEFANESDQREAGFCLPDRAAVLQSGGAVSQEGGHPCVERKAERSHHLDYRCLAGLRTD